MCTGFFASLSGRPARLPGQVPSLLKVAGLAGETVAQNHRYLPLALKWPSTWLLRRFATRLFLVTFHVQSGDAGRDNLERRAKLVPKPIDNSRFRYYNSCRYQRVL